MAMRITPADVWAGELPDQPGGLARVLEQLAGGGARLACCIARRQPDKPGTGVAFVTPITGGRAHDTARAAGLLPADNIATLRVEGTDAPGVGARLARAVADAGVNLRGLSAAVMGGSFVAYFGFDSKQDADRAAAAMRGVSAGPRGGATKSRTTSKRAKVTKRTKRAKRAR